MYKNNALELGIGLGSVKFLPNDDLFFRIF